MCHHNKHNLFIYLFVCQRVLTLDFQVKPVNFIILIQKKGLIEQMQ